MLEIHGKFSLSIISQFKKVWRDIIPLPQTWKVDKNPSELAVPHISNYYRYIFVPVFILYIFHITWTIIFKTLPALEHVHPMEI